eukprot:5656005-Amphidinium_carterae.1
MLTASIPTIPNALSLIFGHLEVAAEEEAEAEEVRAIEETENNTPSVDPALQGAQGSPRTAE